MPLARLVELTGKYWAKWTFLFFETELFRVNEDMGISIS